MTDASAVQPERPLGRDTAQPLDGFITGTAARVFTEPAAVGEHVVMTGVAFSVIGDGPPRRGRAIAEIVAGPDGVGIRPMLGVAKLGITALAAVVVVWCATRRA